MSEEFVDACRIPFVWSLRREREWRRCPRRCFYRYYAAQGGYEVGVGSRETEKIHLLRALLSVPEYCRRTLNLEMRRRLYLTAADAAEEGPTTLPPLAEAVRLRFEREWRAMLLGRPAQDHRLPMLAEALDPRVSGGALSHRVAETLVAEAEALASGGWGELEALPPQERRPIDSPLFVDAGELRCCLVPLAAFRRAGEFWIVDGADPASADEEAVTGVLYRLWAMNCAATPPDRVRTFALTPATGALREFAGDPEISVTLRRIFASASEMMRTVPPDGKTKAADFRAAASAEECAGCPYRYFCGSGPWSVTK